MKNLNGSNIYTSIEDTPMIAWHYFYKNYMIHSTLRSESYILERIAQFAENPRQLALWEMNLKIFKQLGDGANFLDNAFGALIESNDISEIACETRGVAAVGIDKESECNLFYKSIMNQLSYKRLHEGQDYTQFILQLKGYCNALTNDLPIDVYATYFNSLNETESFNFLDSDSWINTIDLEFYELCETMQSDYSRSVKTLTMIEFFTRINSLKKKQKNNT